MKIKEGTPRWGRERPWHPLGSTNVLIPLSFKNEIRRQEWLETLPSCLLTLKNKERFPLISTFLTQIGERTLHDPSIAIYLNMVFGFGLSCVREFACVDLRLTLRSVRMMYDVWVGRHINTARRNTCRTLIQRQRNVNIQTHNSIKRHGLHWSSFIGHVQIQGAHASLWSNFFHFYTVFRKKIGQIIG